jgi:predicted MFS family arabinose efflux permease
MPFTARHLLTIIIGQLLLGIPSACIYVPCLCELSEAFKKKMDADTANTMSLAVFNMSLMLGEAIGPAFGGYVTQGADFTMSCVYASLVCFFYAMVYFMYTYSEIYDYFRVKVSDTLRSQFFIDNHVHGNLTKGGYVNYSSRGSFNIV